MQRHFLRFSPSILFKRCLPILLLAFFTLTACHSPQVTSGDININIQADGETRTAAIPAGSTVAQALQAEDIVIGNLDKTEPPLYAVLNNGDEVTVSHAWRKNSRLKIKLFRLKDRLCETNRCPKVKPDSYKRAQTGRKS